MAPSSLNPAAPEFRPSWLLTGHVAGTSGHQAQYDYTAWDGAEESVTSEELEELEAAEDWVRTMVELDELEREHVIAVALAEAEPAQVLAAEMRAMHVDDKAKSHAGKHKAHKH